MTASERPGIEEGWLDGEPYPQLVDGEERRDGVVHPVIDPSTEARVASWHEATSEEAGAAVAAARRTFDAGVWRRMPPGRRAEVLEEVAARIRKDAPRLAALEAVDTGKAVGGALIYDVYEAATAFAYAAGMARDLHGDVRHASFPPQLLPAGGPDILTMRLREPAGVVCELLPWNGPLMTGSQRIAAALAAGCSVVAKAPEEAVISVVQLGRILGECGLPKGVLNVVLGRGETIGEQLAGDPRIDLVSLTGSVETGRRVMEIASRNLTAVHLELGGKSPVIVFADADMSQAIPWAMMAAFVNMGEVCVAGSRLLVEAPVYEEVVNGVAEAASHLPIGDALDPQTFIGPLVTRQHADRVRGFVDRALSHGEATVVGGGTVPDGRAPTFVAPTVLGGVHPGSELDQEEIFGPVLAAMQFGDEAQAVAIANGTRYGLNATVFTRDIERAFRLADELVCGEVNVNCHFSPEMNGGRGEPRKMSGLSRVGVEGYTALRAINLQIRS
ncbi:MAG TPA: aldehyde dehydrogenase family protein [Candidatus Dormibacteraeota bacterium]|nr:aldehyde dehydrogenase family protein [Candidatus Dormibacteraeota bacterium]